MSSLENANWLLSDTRAWLPVAVLISRSEMRRTPVADFIHDKIKTPWKATFHAAEKKVEAVAPNASEQSVPSTQLPATNIK